MLLEQVAAQVATERLVVATLLAAGAKKVTMPTYDKARADLDAALFAEPRAVDRDREELLKALGVRR